jgi:hypothetical protein
MDPRNTLLTLGRNMLIVGYHADSKVEKLEDTTHPTPDILIPLYFMRLAC